MRTARDDAKVGRNEPCSCGSGKKYKKCCESADASQEDSPVDEKELAVIRSLGEFAEPLTSLAEDAEQLRRAKTIALAAYEIALTCDLLRREQKMEEILRGADDPKVRESLRAIIENMVERHYEMFPDMHKLTVD